MTAFALILIGCGWLVLLFLAVSMFQSNRKDLSNSGISNFFKKSNKSLDKSGAIIILAPALLMTIGIMILLPVGKQTSGWESMVIMSQFSFGRFMQSLLLSLLIASLGGFSSVAIVGGIISSIITSIDRAKKGK